MRKYLSLVLILAVLSGCRNNPTQPDSTKNVKTDNVKVYGQLESVAFPGKIIASSDINLAFRVGGPIIRVNTDIGAFVRKGQVLAEIDPRDYEIQLAATQAEYNRIKGESERIIDLYEKGSVAPNDYEKALYGLQQITARYDSHKNALNDTKLQASCDGYIQKKLFEPGETVGAGVPVISMISAATSEVEINIPSSNYIKRGNFDSYFCTVDVYPEKEFSLDLIGITRKANMNQLYTMHFRLSGSESNKPEPGISTMVTINYKPEDIHTVSVPLTSIFESDGITMVWVYNNETEAVNSRTVKVTEILLDGRVIISDGLSPDETVISAGVHSLIEGEKVKLLPIVSTTNIGGML